MKFLKLCSILVFAKLVVPKSLLVDTAEKLPGIKGLLISSDSRDIIYSENLVQDAMQSLKKLECFRYGKRNHSHKSTSYLPLLVVDCSLVLP